MPGASFSVIDQYKIITDVLDHPSKHGNSADRSVTFFMWIC
jgi:hypothetical protein